MKIDWPSPYRAVLLVSCAVIVGWAGLARGQDEAPEVPTKPAISYQMKPVTGDVANTDAQRLGADADQDNWRLHGRTYDNQRFSPLTGINASNVKQLQPVAMIQTGVANAMEATPLVLFISMIS